MHNIIVKKIDQIFNLLLHNLNIFAEKKNFFYTFNIAVFI